MLPSNMCIPTSYMISVLVDLCYLINTWFVSSAVVCPSALHGQRGARQSAIAGRADPTFRRDGERDRRAHHRNIGIAAESHPTYSSTSIRSGATPQTRDQKRACPHITKSPGDQEQNPRVSKNTQTKDERRHRYIITSCQSIYFRGEDHTRAVVGKMCGKREGRSNVAEIG